MLFKSESLDRKLVYQASGLQVKFVGSILFYDHNESVKEYELQISEETHKRLLQFAIDKAGQPYSIKQLFGIALYMLTDKVYLNEDGRSAYVCSELIGQIMVDVLGITVMKDLDLITPKDLYDILASIYG